MARYKTATRTVTNAGVHRVVGLFPSRKCAEPAACDSLLERDYFLDGLAAQPITKDTFPVAWERMDDSKFARIDRRIAYVSALKNLDIRSPGNPVFRMAVKAVSQRRNENPGPSPHSVYRWLRNYRKSGYDTDGLAQEFACKRERSGRKRNHAAGTRQNAGHRFTQ